MTEQTRGDLPEASAPTSGLKGSSDIENPHNAKQELGRRPPNDVEPQERGRDENSAETDDELDQDAEDEEEHEDHLEAGRQFERKEVRGNHRKPCDECLTPFYFGDIYYQEPFSYDSWGMNRKLCKDCFNSEFPELAYDSYESEEEEEEDDVQEEEEANEHSTEIVESGAGLFRQLQKAQPAPQEPANKRQKTDTEHVEGFPG